MPENERPDDDMEMLSKAIVDAIIKSKDVREAIRKLSDTDESYSKSFMVLMLRVQNLVESIGVDLSKAVDSTPEEKFNPGPIKPSAIKKKKKDFFKNLVDGKIETPSELAFREFLADRF
ncbi:hypothetical protein MNBD_NITROSPINAE03-453, partial [hydrothermal vent metagenome]